MGSIQIRTPDKNIMVGEALRDPAGVPMIRIKKTGSSHWEDVPLETYMKLIVDAFDKIKKS